MHPARHHIRDILAPHGLILPRQTEDEIRHDHRLVVAGQRRQPGQQGLPVIEAGRLLAHAGIKTLHAEREAVEATRQGRLPLLVIKAVEPPLQGQLRIHGQGKTADGAGQAGEIARRHVGWRAAPHIDRRERPALDKRRLGCLVQRPAECLHVATHARRIGAVFEEVAKTAALAAKRDMDIERSGLGLALLLPPCLPAGIVQHQGGGPSPAGMGRRLGGEGEFEGIRGTKPRHGRRKLESRHWGYPAQITQMITNISCRYLCWIKSGRIEPSLCPYQSSSASGKEGVKQQGKRATLPLESGGTHRIRRLIQGSRRERRADTGWRGQPLPMMMATRRFTARPAAVALSAMGASSPRPRISRFPWGIPTDTRTSATDRARLRESCWL